jgi:hypothetical protein
MTCARLTYISFGFFQPLFLAALAGGTVLLDTVSARGPRQLAGREVAWRAVALAARPRRPSFRGPAPLGGPRGGPACGRPAERGDRGAGASLPKNWLGISSAAAPGRRDRAEARRSAAFFLSPLVILAGRARGAKRGRDPRRARRRGAAAPTPFQGLNVYAAPLVTFA